MHERNDPVTEPGQAPRVRLTEEQRIRVDIARRDLNHARAVDLVAMSPADLVGTVETLRSALHDTLRVISEISD
jgi:hypothetical protein